MARRRPHQILTYFIAAVWLVNGFICKVLNLVPRHQEIVSEILGDDQARLFTLVIGILETLMAAWILVGIMPKLNAIVQIIVIASMNALEFFVVPHLLLWGRLNALFAFLLILLIYYNEFHLRKRLDLR